MFDLWYMMDCFDLWFVGYGILLLVVVLYICRSQVFCLVTPLDGLLLVLLAGVLFVVQVRTMDLLAGGCWVGGFGFCLFRFGGC